MFLQWEGRGSQWLNYKGEGGVVREEGGEVEPTQEGRGVSIIYLKGRRKSWSIFLEAPTPGCRDLSPWTQSLIIIFILF